MDAICKPHDPAVVLNRFVREAAGACGPAKALQPGSVAAALVAAIRIALISLDFFIVAMMRWNALGIFVTSGLN